MVHVVRWAHPLGKMGCCGMVRRVRWADCLGKMVLPRHGTYGEVGTSSRQNGDGRGFEFLFWSHGDAAPSLPSASLVRGDGEKESECMAREMEPLRKA